MVPGSCYGAGMDRSSLPRLFALISALGCATNPCDEPCEKLHGNGNGECGIQVSSLGGRADLLEACEAACEPAWQTEGELDGYDPNSTSSNGMELANDEQVEEWMDCVDETSCENLNKGFCQPHF